MPAYGHLLGFGRVHGEYYVIRKRTGRTIGAVSKVSFNDHFDVWKYANKGRFRANKDEAAEITAFVAMLNKRSKSRKRRKGKK